MTLVTRMTLQLSIALPLLALSAASGATESDTSAPVNQEPNYCRINDVIGAKVSMMPGAKAIDEARKDNETAGHPIGKVSELLIDSRTGKTEWAVVSFDKTLGFGGKSVAIPCDQMTWDNPNDQFVIEQNEDQLKALPAFDCADAKKNGLDLSIATLTSHWPKSDVQNSADRSSETRPSIVIDGKHFECAKPQLVLASDLSTNAVYANSEKFGSAAGGLIDRSTRSVVCLFVSRGGTLGVGDTQYLIPFQALRMHGGDGGNAMVYACLRSVKDLEAGVKYVKPANGAVDPEAMRRANEMFVADMPKSDKAKAKAKL